MENFGESLVDIEVKTGQWPIPHPTHQGVRRQERVLFEEFSYKFKPDLGLRSLTFKVVLEKTSEENFHAKTNDNTFNVKQGSPRVGLAEMDSQL